MVTVNINFIYSLGFRRNDSSSPAAHQKVAQNPMNKPTKLDQTAAEPKPDLMKYSKLYTPINTDIRACHAIDVQMIENGSAP